VSALDRLLDRFGRNEIHIAMLGHPGTHDSMGSVFCSRWASESSVAFGRRISHMDPVAAGFEPAINVADTLYSGGFLGGVDNCSGHHFQSREALTFWPGEVAAVLTFVTSVNK